MRLKPAFLFLVLLASALPVRGVAPLVVELGVADIEHPAFTARELSLRLEDSGDRRALRLRIGRLVLPGLDRPLRDLVIDCPDSRLPLPALDCPEATLVLAQGPWGPQKLKLAIRWKDARHGSLSFRGLRHPAGRLSGRLDLNGQDWTLEARGRGLRPGRVAALRQALRKAGIRRLHGRVTLSAKLEGRGGEPRRLRLEGSARGLAWSDAAGEQAGEKVRLRLEAKGRRLGAAWKGRLHLALQGGEVFSDPVFLDLGKQPLALTAEGRWQPERLHLERLTLDAGKALRLRGTGTLDLQPPRPRELQLRIDSEDFGRLYATLLQPLLAGGPLDDLQVQGRGGAHLRWEGGKPTWLDLALERVKVTRGDGGFGIDGLVGDLHWRARGESPDSSLRFVGFNLGPLDFGGARLLFNTAGRYAYLRRTLRVPFYEGLLVVPEATWLQTDAGGDGGFGLRLRDVSLEALSTDLDWPRMLGTINAQIPRARYRNGSLRVDGDILVEAFDGTLRVRDLRLEELGSAAPVLTANVELRHLDLLKLTRTFSFGDIQGRLDGEIRGLRLVAWEPDRFDARFHSTPGDDSRHRISQRAVQNLTELGNGVTGALSAGFMGLFKEFSYDRIELKLRQRGDHAWIDGIPAPDGGYYLVKGAGIPRIDVIGRNREVAWKDLVARLRSIRVEGMRIK